MTNKLKRLGLLLSVCTLVSVLMVGCVKNKVAIGHEQFKTELESRGYTVNVLTTQDNIGDAVALLEATKDNTKLEYIEVNNTADAIVFFDELRSEFDSMEVEYTSKVDVALQNYEKLGCVYEGTYTCFVRVDNTMVYFYSPEGTQAEFETFLREIGY